MKQIALCFMLFCFSASPFLAQDKIHVELKDAKPDIYIDGKKYGYEIYDLLDQDKIATVNVLKGEWAKAEYNAPNGVILITTKKAAQKANKQKDSPIDVEEDSKVRIRSEDGTEPIIIIDGKVADRKTLSKLSPKDIESIDVLKGEKALKKHNAPNGVIIVNTKN